MNREEHESCEIVTMSEVSEAEDDTESHDDDQLVLMEEHNNKTTQTILKIKRVI